MARQKEIPGTERVKHPEVEAAAGIIRTELKKQTRAAKKIKDTKPTLIAAMRKAGITAYRDDEAGFVVTISDGPVKVEITDVKDEPDDEPEEAEDEKTAH